MTVAGFTSDAEGKNSFGTKIDEVVSVGTPVSSIQFLKGREAELQHIDRALFQAGRHIFVFGDRGVGKSSLTATAAVQYADARPISVGGSPDDTFASIIANIGAQALNRSKTEQTRQSTAVGMEWRGFKWTSSKEVSALDLKAEINTVGDAAELLKEIASKHSKKPAVVLDEFDAIPNVAERGRFAALLKQLGDQSVNVKFFISGVAKSCEELLGAHPSAYRQLATIELERLGWSGRREIVDEALGAFEINCDNDVNWRIAAISDGFPYYVHLMVEHMLWEAYDDDEEVRTLVWKHFYDGLRGAIKDTNVELKKPYERAVLQRPTEYEDVVWATADGEDLFRSIADIRFSYERVREKRPDRPHLEPSKVSEVVRRLKTPSVGRMLSQVPGRKGWYTYSEKMVRGFVRMQAESQGVQLTGERPAPRQTMHVANARTGYRGSDVPPGVKVNASIWPPDREEGGHS